MGWLGILMFWNNVQVASCINVGKEEDGNLKKIHLFLALFLIFMHLRHRETLHVVFQGSLIHSHQSLPYH